MNGALLIANDIRDIRGPIELPARIHWELWLGGALLLLVLSFALRRYLKVRRVPTPYELARAQLDRARHEASEERGDRLAERVSGTVRGYVESRFGLRAAHRTSEDFLSELLRTADSPLSPYRAQLERFLATCDLAKFAGRELAGDVRAALCMEAMRFVEEAERTMQGSAS
jgi:hypothetical protein